MEELDYNRLQGRIIHSEEFRKLQWKEAPAKGFINADQFARGVANFTNRITSSINSQNRKKNISLRVDSEYCELLAYIKYLGMPAYGREGKIALDETIGKSYSQADINISLAKKKLRIELPEKMIDDIRQMEYKNFDEVTSNEARVVLLAQNMVEALKLLTPEETKKLGGILLSDTLTEECTLDENGKIIPGRVYNKITPVLQQRRKPINEEKIEKAKQSMEENLMEGIIEQPKRQREEDQIGG